MWLILQSTSIASILHRTDFFAPYVCSDEASALANNSDTWNQWERIIHMLQTSKSDKWHLLWPTYIPPHSKYPNLKIEVVTAASLTTITTAVQAWNCTIQLFEWCTYWILLFEFLKVFLLEFEYFPWVLSFLEYELFQKGPISTPELHTPPLGMLFFNKV